MRRIRNKREPDNEVRQERIAGMWKLSEQSGIRWEEERKLRD